MSSATKNFNRLSNEYGRAGMRTRTAEPMASGFSSAPSYSGHAFSASGVYDRLLLLLVLAVGAAAYGYALAPSGLAVGAIIVGFVVGLVGSFVPRLARFAGPVYALAEGIALGWVSARYAGLGGGIVPLAVVFTGAVFFGTLAVYRTGLVRVTPRFLSMTIVATFALAMVALLSLFGLHIPGVNDLGTGGLVFGVIGLLVAVLNLFVDFSQVEQAEQRGLDSSGEWYAAFSIMLALVLVYLSVLRIIASSRR